MSELANNISLIYGEDGQKWLENLPLLQEKLAAKFELQHLNPFENLTYNYVAAGMQNDLPVVLKIGFGHYEIEQEYQATLAFKGQALAQAIDYSFEDGALLLARAIPGQTLVTLFPERD